MKKVLSLVACAAIVVSLTTKVNGQTNNIGDGDKLNKQESITESIKDKNLSSPIEKIELVEEVVSENVEQVEELTAEDSKEENNDSCLVDNNNEDIQRKIGMITNMYRVGDKTYIDIDMAEFFRGEEALTEALKDEDGKYYYEDGAYHVPDGYYLRNKDREITTYEVSENAEYYLCEYLLNIDTGISANLVNVSGEYFNQYIIEKQEHWLEGKNRATLVWLNINNGQVDSLKMQYTP